MKILLDTNIVLDLLLEREPFYNSSKEIFLLAEEKKLKAYLSASSITTIHYLVSKALKKQEADSVIAMLLEIFSISPLDKNILLEAITNNGVDFEDSVIYSSAFKRNIDYIITRDKQGFKNSKVKILEPNNFLALYKEIEI